MNWSALIPRGYFCAHCVRWFSAARVERKPEGRLICPRCGAEVEADRVERF